LLSAVNTAVAAQLGLLFMMSREGDMPKQFSKLNRQGVPRLPLAISVALPIIVPPPHRQLREPCRPLCNRCRRGHRHQSGFLGNKQKLEMSFAERLLMGVTAVILIAVEFTLAHTKHDALFFVVCVLIIGLGLWAYSRRLSGITTLTVSREVAEIVKPELVENLRKPVQETQKILVSARDSLRRWRLLSMKRSFARLHFMCSAFARSRCSIQAKPLVGRPTGGMIPRLSAILNTAACKSAERAGSRLFHCLRPPLRVRR
jgi:hypothetical protein